MKIKNTLLVFFIVGLMIGVPLATADSGQTADSPNVIPSIVTTSSAGSSGSASLAMNTIVAYPYIFSLAKGDSYKIPGSDFSIRLTGIGSIIYNENQNMQSQTIDLEICLSKSNVGTCAIYDNTNIGQTLTQYDGNAILKITPLYIDENNYVHFKYGFNNPVDTNIAPVIDGVSGPQYLAPNEQGTWTVKAHDNDKTLSYSVDWGDEPQYQMMTAASTQKLMALSQTSTFTHSYIKSGDYTVVFTVTDQNGQSAKSTITVHVDNNSVVVPTPVPQPVPEPSDKNARLKSLYSQLLEILKEIIDLQNSTN